MPSSPPGVRGTPTALTNRLTLSWGICTRKRKLASIGASERHHLARPASAEKAVLLVQNQLERGTVGAGASIGQKRADGGLATRHKRQENFDDRPAVGQGPLLASHQFTCQTSVTAS